MMASTVSAADIAPDAFNESDQSDVEDTEDHVDDLTYDLYNLVACDHHPIKVDGSEDLESVLLTRATEATQLLVNRLFKLPVEPSDVGPVAVLPNELFRIPREKPPPEPKGETVWQKFAREKGIKKKKKERMVFDEVTEEYKPRYGYKGINQGVQEHAIVEVKPGQDPTADPWAAERAAKKARVEKNEKHRARNIERLTVGKGRGKKGKDIPSYDPAAVPGIPVEIRSNSAPGGKRGKQGLRQALQLAQHSTASMGRFDAARYGEPEKKIRGKKRSFRDNIADDTLMTEKKTMKNQLRIVEDKIYKKKAGVTNSLKPYEGILPDAPSDSFKQKKGKGSFKSTLEDQPKKKKRTK